MTESIAIIILFSSFFGMVAIFVRRMSELKSLKVVEEPGISFIKVTKEKIKDTLSSGPRQFLGSNSWDVFLQKVLSKVKIFSLKIEAKSSQLLERKREKNKKRKEDEKYWEKMSKTILKKKKQKKNNLPM